MSQNIWRITVKFSGQTFFAGQVPRPVSQRIGPAYVFQPLNQFVRCKLWFHAIAILYYSFALALASSAPSSVTCLRSLDRRCRFTIKVQPYMTPLDCTCICFLPLILQIITCHLRMASCDVLLLSVHYHPSAYSLVWCGHARLHRLSGCSQLDGCLNTSSFPFRHL